MNDYKSEIIGVSCELHVSYKGYSYATVVEDYGYELLVQLSSGKTTVKTGDYTISYCHLSQQYVNVNDFVYAGTIIACSGNTGASTGPHLHLTAKKDGKAFNPTILLEYIESTIDN